jgi:hypothetical protein
VFQKGREVILSSQRSRCPVLRLCYVLVKELLMKFESAGNRVDLGISVTSGSQEE